MEVFHPILCFFLFSKFVPDASWLASAETFGARQRIRLEEHPQEVVRDLMLLEKWAKTLDFIAPAIFPDLDNLSVSSNNFQLMWAAMETVSSYVFSPSNICNPPSSACGSVVVKIGYTEEPNVVQSGSILTTTVCQGFQVAELESSANLELDWHRRSACRRS